MTASRQAAWRVGGARERGMRLLLIGVIASLVAANLLDYRMSLGPGLTLENALLYASAGAIVFKLTLHQDVAFRLRALHACFVILIAYSVLSLFMAEFAVDYPRYNLIKSGMSLKNRLVDQAIYFFVFFYALRESRNAHTVLKVLLLAVGLGSAIALLNAFGVAQIGDAGENEAGRVETLMGEPNQDGAFLCLFLPALVASMMSSRWLHRMLWLGIIVASLGALILTASRGAFLALVVSSIWGVALFRHHLSLRRIVSFAAWSGGIIATLVIVLSIRYGHLLYKRVISDSTASDAVGASSGRLEFWSLGLSTMMDSPLTLITGFGWDTWWLFPFPRAPHNHYLGLYFDLGLVGLVCGTMLLALVLREARAALPFTPAPYRPVLISFSFGVIAIAIAAFFVDLFPPWAWFWAYAGLAMRIAVNAKAEHSNYAVKAEPASLPPRDPFGWAGSTR